ncbi:hypothetical protein E1J38_003720 [Seonamhaeicola sediminis]|uniref:Uncharacterized protein n=1 Tax=Seonamhaeicola sediminis TaxID=2528206 RepID=A0A562YG87_9FLAO|nr:hypothetical protein [Seonamhaeicola sediminis]TWO33893.1 hypothetical protein E1J38_003720 [Seonamhaeicola sediminis]
MKNLYLSVILLFLVIQTSFSQAEWLTVNFTDFQNFKKPIEVINLVDEENGNVAIFFKYSNTIRAYLYDKDKKLINKLLVDKLPRFSVNYLGCSNFNSVYTLFFKNIGSTKFSSLTIDFKNSTFNSTKDIGLFFKKETYVESFEDNNRVYILTSIDKTSKLNLYELFYDNRFELKLIDLSDEVFEKPNGFRTNLNFLIRGLNQESMTTSIKVGEPSSLELASAKNKLYYNNNVITFTSNYFDHCTYIIDINVDDGSYEYSKFDNVNYKKEDLWNKANSFIYGDYFFNMYISKEGLTYDIYDRSTKELIKRLNFSRKDSIRFKNTPIILEGGDFKNYRELDKTTQFIRKVTNSKISTYVYKMGGNYVISIGSSEPKQQAQMGYYYPGGLVGGLMAIAAHQLLTSSYHSYITTKSTRIECLFDESFNHVSGNIPLNGFDRIKEYVDKMNLETAPLQTIFKTGNDYIFGYYNKDLNSYIYTNI